jgi:hypothetical protein
VIGRTAGTTSSTGLAGVRTTTREASSGSQRSTGSPSARRPSSTSIITAAAVIGFVIEAMRKIESRAIGTAPPTAAAPTAWTSTCSPRASRATAPGTEPSETWASRRSRRLVVMGIKTSGGTQTHRPGNDKSRPRGGLFSLYRQHGRKP